MPTRKYDDFYIQLTRGLDLKKTSDLQREIDKLVSSICKFMSVGRASIWLYSEDNQSIECQSLYILTEDKCDRGTILSKNDFGSYFKVLENQRIIEANDANTHPATACFSEVYLKPLGIISMIDIPIWNIDKVIGVLCLEYLEYKNDWSAEEKYFITSVADLIAKLYDKYQVLELVENLEEKVKLRTEELTDALDNLKNTQQILIESEKLASLGTVVSGVAHEIRNPLNHISMATDIIMEAVEDFSVENFDDVELALTKSSEILMNEVYRVDSIISDMIDSSASKDRRSSVDLNALIEKAAKLSIHHIDNELQIHPNLNFERVGELYISRQSFLRVFINLFENAFRAVLAKSKRNSDYRPKIEVSTQVLGEQVEIVFSDNGIGIPQNIRKNIFQPFYTTKVAGLGTGLGLSIVYDIIKQYSGSIDIDSQEGEYTKVKLSIPILREEL